MPVGSEEHLIEKMVFRVPKVTYGPVSNGAFDDALGTRTAIAPECFRTWWTLETTDMV